MPLADRVFHHRSRLHPSAAPSQATAPLSSKSIWHDKRQPAAGISAAPGVRTAVRAHARCPAAWRPPAAGSRCLIRSCGYGLYGVRARRNGDCCVCWPGWVEPGGADPASRLRATGQRCREYSIVIRRVPRGLKLAPQRTICHLQASHLYCPPWIMAITLDGS